MRARNGPSETIDNALADQYRDAGIAIISVQTLALPEVGAAGSGLLNSARFGAIGTKPISASAFFDGAKMAPRVVAQQKSNDFHAFSPVVEKLAAKFAKVT